jgi:isochorismate pyruvate lyase|tara:strand:- start:148 stop:453 length:306 start_codon:yes stop_codon:yes gene_type:complete
MTELTKPGDCNSMDELRHQIDKLDVKIIELLANRSEFIDRATELKKSNGMPARIPERIESVVSNARNAAEELDLDADLVEKIWRILIDWSIQREAEIIREE